MLTRTTRTCPSWPENPSSTRPRCHWPRGAFWSTTSTTSPTFRFSLASLHFFRVLSVDWYSSLQRFQNTLTRFWISLQRFLGLNAMSSVTWGASCPPSYPTKKWLGVNTGSSRGSAPSYVNGLEFINTSTFLKAVCSSSSVSPAFPTIAFRVFLASLTSDSNTPPKYDPSGGFLSHLIPLLTTLPVIYSWSIAWTSSLSSLSAPTKFVPLSLVTSSGLALVATIRLNAFRKSVVLNEHAISRCTALVAEHVNRHKYLYQKLFE